MICRRGISCRACRGFIALLKRACDRTALRPR
jgi:hypothetical protein